MFIIGKLVIKISRSGILTDVMHQNCKGYSAWSIVSISGQIAISKPALKGNELCTYGRVRIKERRTKMNERGNSSRQ